MLSQHFIQSFAPGEVTPEQALEIGKQLCEKLLHGEYQYFLAVHTDKSHVHLHCIFNNINMMDGKTFETHENRKCDPSCKKLMHASDQLCREHHLSVIEDSRSTKGKSHYEWEMDRQGKSWKSRLKNAIDEVVKVSEDFEDFLRICRESGILVEYNPQHKIDLKFMLAGQKANNPRSRMTRAKTLGWFYETKQIIRRIENYRGIMAYTPRTRIIKTTTERMTDAVGLQRWADRANMKEASRALNLISQRGLTPQEAETAALAAFAKAGHLKEQMNSLSTQIEDVDLQIKTAQKYRKYRAVYVEYKALSGRQKARYEVTHRDELKAYQQAAKQLAEWYPDGNAPTVSELEQKKNALTAERSHMAEQRKAAIAESEELGKAMQTLSDYLDNEREAQEQRRKQGDLE